MKTALHLFTQMNQGDHATDALQRPVQAFLLSTIDVPETAQAIPLPYIYAAFRGWFCEFMKPVYEAPDAVQLVGNMSMRSFERTLRRAMIGVQSGGYLQPMLERREREHWKHIPELRDICVSRFSFLFYASPSTLGHPLPSEERIQMEKSFPAVYQTSIRTYTYKGVLPLFTKEDWKLCIEKYLTMSEREKVRAMLKTTHRTRERIIQQSSL